MTRGIKRRRRTRRERKREMPKREYGYDNDQSGASPWTDSPNWPCLNKSHFIEVEIQSNSDDGEIEPDTRRCAVCGLTVQYRDDDDLYVPGYIISGKAFADLESARQIFQSETSLMFVSVKAAQDIADLCQRAGVVRLDLFGAMESMLAGPDGDLNILVRFDDCADNLFSRYFDLKEGLERILANSGRGVTLVEERAVKNPYRKKAINGDRMKIYEA